MEDSVDAWRAAAEAAIDDIACHGRVSVRSRGEAVRRVVGRCVCLPVFCSPCLVWSCAWRLLCCPASCFQHGLGGTCGDNGCTRCSDGAVASAWTSLDGSSDATLDPALIPARVKEDPAFEDACLDLVVYAASRAAALPLLQEAPTTAQAVAAFVWPLAAYYVRATESLRGAPTPLLDDPAHVEATPGRLQRLALRLAQQRASARSAVPPG